MALPLGTGRVDWPKWFGEALAKAVASVISKAAGAPIAGRPLSLAERGRRWFIDHYPLLGSLAVAFELVEDPIALARMQVSIAAVDPETKEIYVDGRRLDEASCRFVLAHEMLHVGLRHGARRQGRDPFLWNVACDYVINGWLVEMGIGDLPEFGGLFDPSLKGLSAEALYDRIVTDLRRYRKVATLRGAARRPWCQGGLLRCGAVRRRVPTSRGDRRQGPRAGARRHHASAGHRSPPASGRFPTQGAIARHHRWSVRSAPDPPRPRLPPAPGE